MQKRIRIALVLAVCFLVLVPVMGCGGKEYDMETDAEFQAAMDRAVERILGEEASATKMYEELAEQFADRYEQMDILDAVQARLVEVREQLKP